MVQEIVNECWRSIDGYINYQVSNLGRVRNSNTGRILTGSRNSFGYLTVSLSKDKSSSTQSVHRLVAREFLENPGNKTSVDHIDRDKTNNNITNLRWATQSENLGNGSKRTKGSSNFKGVSRLKRTGKWQAQIKNKGRSIHLGYFDDEIDAANAYNAKAIELFGEYACLNKIDEDNTLDYDDEDESETEATDETAE